MKKTKRLVELSMVDHTSKLSIWETEVDNELEANLGYLAKAISSNNQSKNEEVGNGN